MSAPILWTDRNYAAKARRPARRWNLETGQREAVLDDLGRPAFERVPQTGRVGVVRQVDDIANTKPMAAPRSIRMLRDDGNEVDVVIRSAAAAGNGEQGSDHSFARYQGARASHFGWLPEGCCPVDLVTRRARNPLQLFAIELRALAAKGEGCRPGEVGTNKPPCRHYVAERAARQARRLKEHEASVDRAKSAAERTTDALVEFVGKMDGRAPSALPAEEFAPQKKGPTK